MQILKFRTFSSREQEGFIFVKRGALPQLILEDILFQLFESLFPTIHCPEIYYFSSTDQILRADELPKVKDFIYVHFLERIPKYVRNKTVEDKLKIGCIEKMSTGYNFAGTSLYIFSEKKYLMYGYELFRETMEASIAQLYSKQERKKAIYSNYIQEIEHLKDNFEMIKLKNQIVEKVEMFQEKVTHLETMNARYLKIKATLLQVLKSSGISICSLKDLQ